MMEDLPTETVSSEPVSCPVSKEWATPGRPPVGVKGDWLAGYWTELAGRAKHRKIILRVLFSLMITALTGFGIWYSYPFVKAFIGVNAPANLTISSSGDELVTYGYDELRLLAITESEKTDGDSSESFVYEGATLQEVLESADANILDGATRVVAHGYNGYEATYTIDELDSVIVAYECDGKNINEGGPFRVIFLNDYTGARAIEYLVSLDVL